MKAYVRTALVADLERRLKGSARLIQVISGPRQVGKTTVAHQVRERWGGATLYFSADQPDTPDRAWVRDRWGEARRLRRTRGADTLLVLDEIQKIPGWSQVVKALWDEDRREGGRLRVVLLGSSALLVQRGLTESLTGRFELHRHAHWGFAECRAAFGLGLEEYLRFGGYPGALRFRRDPLRWAQYLRDAVIETVVGKDILLMSPVQKPALLRQTWGMAAAHPAEIVSLQKFLGQLTDAGNATTIASYLHLLEAAFLISPLHRWSGSRVMMKASSPKLVIRDNGLVNAMSPPLIRGGVMEPSRRGRLAENAVGSALLTLAAPLGAEVSYWRERDLEVDYVLSRGAELFAIEVKTGAARTGTAGLTAFQRRWPHARAVVIAERPDPEGGELGLAGFLADPAMVFGAGRRTSA